VLAAWTPPVGDAVATGSLPVGVGELDPDREGVEVGNTEPVGVGVGVGDPPSVGVGLGVGDGPGVSVGGEVHPITRTNPVAKRPLTELPVASLSSW